MPHAPIALGMSLVIHSTATRDRGRRRRSLHLQTVALSAVGALCLNNNVHSQQSGGIYSLGVSADAQVRFSWKSSSEPTLAGYKLYVGTFPRMYASSVDVGFVSNFQLTGLIRGMRYYFALTAYNSEGIESDFTPELTWEAPLQTGTVTPADISQAESAAALNSPPAMTSLSDQILAKNETSEPIVFTVSDAETPLSELRVATSSSNHTVVPESGLVIAGFEAERVLLINPSNGRAGSSHVTISVSDGSATTTLVFLVTVMDHADEERPDSADLVH